jgi:hypothetical protein
MVRVGTDASDEFRDRRRAYSTQRYQLGNYREDKIFLQETNADFLLTFNKKLNTDFNITAAVGGNMRRKSFRQSDVSAPELAVPGIYTLGNSKVALIGSTFQSEKRVNSLYATTQISYLNSIFLDLTARNDWSSTLPSDNWSYFYPSANLSVVLSDLMEMDFNGVLSYAKVRAGVAQVGNDTDPYALVNTYSAQTAAKGLPAYSESTVLANKVLKPEISTNFETGIELKFFENRIGLDVTYYNSRSKNQIIQLPLSNTTGYSARTINAGLVQNQGIEVMLNLIPVQLKNSFTWSIDVNYSRNRSKVIELFTDPITGEKVKNYQMASRYMSVQAREGGRMGDMYAIGYQRVSNDPKSPYFDASGKYVGQVVYTSQGKPVPTSETILMGNYNPDWLMGINNTFSFKGISLSFLFDIRQGGKVYSHTQTVGREGGVISETLEGRANGYDLSLEGNGVIGQGVVQNEDGTFTPTTDAYNAGNEDLKLSAREWHSTITLGRSLLESMVYDASFVKLRELKLGYTIPNKLLGKLPFRDVNVSLVGRNLFVWSNVPHIDPENASTVGGTIIPGIESVSIPSSRSYGFNINFKL